MTRLVPWQTRSASVFDNLRREMDQLMDRFGNTEGNGGVNWFAPRTNVAETEKAFEITVDLPGLKAEDVNIELREGSLWISGERKHEEETKDRTFHLVERTYGQFKRGIALGPDVDSDNVQASYKDGVLQVSVPKAPAACPKKIEVKSS